MSLLWGSTTRADWIWVEGEKPVHSTMHRHPWWYDQVHKDQLSGGDLISNFADQPGEADYEFTVKPPAARPLDPSTPRPLQYDFWVRTNPLDTSLSYRLNAGDWIKIDTKKDPLDLINIAADNKPDLRFIAWIKVGKVQLAPGKNTIAFRMDSPNHNHGYLDCFVFDTEPFHPSGALKPDELGRHNQELAAQNQGWVPFQPADDPFTAAALDLRTLNEPAAGAQGRIAARGGQFVHSATGVPVRFWAVNGVGNAEDASALRLAAKTLAKHGVNLVRLHGGMFDQDGNADPAHVQRSIATVAQLKAEGIYSHFSIYFPLWLQPKPGTPWLQGYDGHTHPFGALFFNPDFQRQYQSWWKALLLTPGPGGQRLVDDPAIASLEIQNEDSLFFWTFNDKIPDPELRLLETRFATWLQNRYGTLDKALAAWGNLKVQRDVPAQGRIGFRPLWNMFSQRTARDQDTAAFLVQTQQIFYQETIQFLRSLGYKGLITCSNWITADARILTPLEKRTYTTGDYIDRHGYFGCLEKGDNDGWSVRDGHTYADRSALRFEAEEPGKPRALSNPVEDPSYNNLPSMISETTFNRPNRYRSEAPLYYAAYGSLQDTDCIVHFAYDTAQWRVKPGFFMQPWTLMTPAMVGQFPAAALLFRKSLVTPGDLMINLNLRTADIEHLSGSPLAPEAGLDELRQKDVPLNAPAAGAAVSQGIIDPLVHFVGRTNINFTTDARPSVRKDLAPFIDRTHRKVTSSNGQLVLDYDKGILTINAPCAQAISGNLKAAGAVGLRDITITSDLDLGHIIAISLDDKPLATSAKILLQVMSEEKATGFATRPVGNNLKKIESIGHDPWLLRSLSGTVHFKRPDAATLKVIPLDPNGYPTKTAAPASAAAITLSPDTLYYIIMR